MIEADAEEAEALQEAVEPLEVVEHLGEVTAAQRAGLRPSSYVSEKNFRMNWRL